MKTIFAVVAALAALTGCATQQPAYYTTARVQDPYQWHTVSSEPVYRNGATAASVGPSYTTEELPVTTTSSRVVYTTEPVYAPVQTVYVAQPAYYAPAPSYYYPPVSIGLDFMFTNHGWGGWGGRGGRGGYRHR